MMRAIIANCLALALVGMWAPLVAGQAAPIVTGDIGVVAHAFDISQVTLNDGRVQENQVRHQSLWGEH